MNFCQIFKNRIIKIGKKEIQFRIWQVSLQVKIFKSISIKLCNLDRLNNHLKDSSNQTLNKIKIK